jgi:GT2 family glycosyltransferase
MNTPLISVNLLLYKPGFYLKPCLKSIFSQTYKNIELLIIDNCSNDGTVDKAKEIIASAEQSAPFCKIIANKENLGFAGGHNLGIRESRGELVVMVNQDVVFDENFIQNIVKVFTDNKIGSAQGKLLRLKIENKKLSKTNIIDNAGLVILKNRRIIARGQGQKDGAQFAAQEEIFGVDGALPVYRRDALRDTKIGDEYFDNDFFAYKEDVDLAWRLRLFGWQALYVPSAVAWHGRTAGESAATNYFGIIKERIKIGKFAKYLSFKNQRLMQIKNEQPRLLLKHIFWWLPKEVASWIYVILFEHYTWKAIRDLFRQAPRAFEKRKIIMARKRMGEKEIGRWFI